MPTRTVEDYVKQLYLEQQKSSRGLVPMGCLAGAMRVVPGTATTMIKALADAGLVQYSPRAGVRLSRGGEQLALRMLRRHRLVEMLLVKILGLDWSEVHGEAEELEHSISDKVLDRIDALLGRPRVDPHGDPIPTARGRMSRRRLANLAECRPGGRFVVARVLDQNPKFLHFVARHGLLPGRAITVERRDVQADSVVVRNGKGSATLGAAAAAKILVSGVCAQRANA
jgi:DtxR family Mn-dependent transcriptional regulator